VWVLSCRLKGAGHLPPAPLRRSIASRACRSIRFRLGWREHRSQSGALCFPARRHRLFPCVNELDAIALVLEAIGEPEPLPSALLALILAGRQWCEGEVAHTANTRETHKCLCARRRQGPDAALITT
jgi:hypothetical protein